MFRKLLAIITASLSLTGALSAELHWWRPQEVPALNGYTDSYAIAINRHGTAIAVFDNKIFGCYDMRKNSWVLKELDCVSGEIPILNDYSIKTNYQYMIGKSSKGKIVTLNDQGQGFVVINVPEGVHQGKIAVVEYTPTGWGPCVVLSETAGGEPTLAASGYDKRSLVLWLNKSDDEHQGELMGSYYNGSQWISQGVLSQYHSVDIDYNQLGPQLVMNDLGDAVVVWKAQEFTEVDEEALLVAKYFDGIAEDWCGEDIIGIQSIEKKGFDLVMNYQGEVLLVWDAEEGIESASFNFMKYMMAKATEDLSSSEVSEQCDEMVLPLPQWVRRTIAQGEEMHVPKACLDRQGNAVAIWLVDNSGIGSAYLKQGEISWELIQDPVVSEPAYAASMQFDSDGHKARMMWIGDGKDMNEVIYSREFDFLQKRWKEIEAINGHDTSSLVATIDAVSLGKSACGIIMWYDFFKDKLLYSVLKEGYDSSYDKIPAVKGRAHRKEALYQKKVDCSRRRAERRARENQ